MKQTTDKALGKAFIQQFYKKNRVIFGVVVFSTLFMGGLNLMASWLIQQLIDTISGVPGARDLQTLVLWTIGLILLVVLVGSIEYLSKPRFMKRAMQQYKDYIFEMLTRKSVHSFQKEKTATYISALTNDMNSVEENYLEKQFALIMNLVMFVGAFVMMLLYSPLLTLAAVGLTILPIIASVFVGNRLETAELEVSERNKGFVDTIKESIYGFSVIKSFKAEKAALELYIRSNRDVETAKCKKRKISTIVAVIAAVAGLIAQLGVFVVGAYLALNGRNVTPGVVIAFVNLMNFVIQPISALPEIFASRKAAKALMEKLWKALNENVDKERKTEVNQLCHGIEMKQVSFAYEEGKEVLRDINLTFEAGKSYAIVGTSGSGKSTILNLLLAAQDNYKGSIYYDEHELQEISHDSLYDMVSIVQQNVIVFNASLRDNITMFQDMPVEEVDKAIDMAGLRTFVERHGEDYLCGENGNALSGGEKQRISIARSLLRKASVLLVDEATAALDAQTAYQVANSILDIRDLTKIVITHSLDEKILKRYDGIIVLKAGQVVEKGNFDGLMEKKEYFYSLYTISQ